VLVKPDVSVSTAEIYKRIDDEKDILHPDTDAALDAVKNRDYEKLFGCMQNVMERVTEKICPEIAKISENMRDFGAKAALMSGSGPTVYGVFEDNASAKKAFDALSVRYKQAFLAHICE